MLWDYILKKRSLGSFAAVSLITRAALQIGLETHRAGGDVARYSALEASYLMLGFMIGVGLLALTDLGPASIFIGTAVAALVALVFDLPVMLRRARGHNQLEQSWCH